MIGKEKTMAQIKYVGENGNYGLKTGKEYKADVKVKNTGVTIDMNSRDTIRMPIAEYRKNFKHV